MIVRDIFCLLVAYKALARLYNVPHRGASNAAAKRRQKTTGWRLTPVSQHDTQLSAAPQDRARSLLPRSRLNVAGV